ncbi:hypothetical protein GCM10027446_17140 [Angustibacter peucedani]
MTNPSSSGPRPGQPGAPGGLRRSVEAASRPLLLRLTALPRPVPFLVLLAVLVVGVLVGGPVGVVCTALVVLFVAWLMFLSWPRLTGPEKLGRVAVLAVAVALCVVQAFPR